MSYELTEDQSSTIICVAKYMKITAYATISSGLIDLLIGLSKESYFDMLFTLFIFATGLAFYLPAGNLKRIVEKEGADIKELMQAFSDLNRGWIVVIGVLLIVALFSIINSLAALF